jgi:hypothetical protein
MSVNSVDKPVVLLRDVKLVDRVGFLAIDPGTSLGTTMRFRAG